MNLVRAGQLNRRIQIQRPSTVRDSMGGPQRTWINLATIWAEIQPLSGQELESTQRMASEITHQITVR